MTPPSDDPGLVVTVLAVVAALAAIVFGVYVLGGYRWFVTAEKAVRPALVLAAVMALTAGAFLLAVRHENQQREDAWNRYDEWLERQRTSQTESPPG